MQNVVRVNVTDGAVSKFLTLKSPSAAFKLTDVKFRGDGSDTALYIVDWGNIAPPPTIPQSGVVWKITYEPLFIYLYRTAHCKILLGAPPSLHAVRLFVAADVSSKVGIIKLQQDIAEYEGWSPDEVKPVEKQNLHFTLMFLGESEGSMVDRIKSKLSHLRFEPFRITYTGIGGHPDMNSANKIWVGVDGEGAARLSVLSSRVAAKLGELDMEPDKPFVPQVPIFHAKEGRLLELGKPSAKYRGKSFGSDLIDKVHLKKSEAGGSGYTYSRIFTKALGAP